MKNKCRHAFGTEIDLVINGTLHAYSTKSFHQTSYTAFHLSLTTREDIALKNASDTVFLGELDYLKWSIITKGREQKLAHYSLQG